MFGINERTERKCTQQEARDFRNAGGRMHGKEPSSLHESGWEVLMGQCGPQGRF